MCNEKTLKKRSRSTEIFLFSFSLFVFKRKKICLNMISYVPFGIEIVCFVFKSYCMQIDIYAIELTVKSVLIVNNYKNFYKSFVQTNPYTYTYRYE